MSDRFREVTVTTHMPISKPVTSFLADSFRQNSSRPASPDSPSKATRLFATKKTQASVEYSLRLDSSSTAPPSPSPHEASGGSGSRPDIRIILPDLNLSTEIASQPEVPPTLRTPSPPISPPSQGSSTPRQLHAREVEIVVDGLNKNAVKVHSVEVVSPRTPSTQCACGGT